MIFGQAIDYRGHVPGDLDQWHGKYGGHDEGPRYGHQLPRLASEGQTCERSAGAGSTGGKTR